MQVPEVQSGLRALGFRSGRVPKGRTR